MSFYDIKITGKDVKRFVRNLHKMHINIHSINYYGNSVIIKVSLKDLLKIRRIKTIYKIEVIKYYGIALIKHFFKVYKLLLAAFIISFILFLSLTNIIFEVEVKHNDKTLRKMILDELREKGISKYHFVVSYRKKEKIKNEILTKYNDQIEWIEINRKGTKYEVEVEERKKNEKNDSETPRNIIAKKNGLVTKIISNHGEIVTKINQYVKKGDLLISGVIHNKDKVVGSVKAEGEVLAETWYTIKVELPYHYYEEKKTSNKKIKVVINFLNKEITIPNNKYNSSISTPKFTIKNTILPISLSIKKIQEIKTIDQVYTMDNAINVASDIATKRLKENLGKNIEIIYEKNLKIEEKNSKIIVVMFYKTIENITDYQEIQNVEENNTEIR